MTARNAATLGVAYVLLGALAASFTGVLLRHVEDAGPWQVLYYRSLGFMAIMLVFVLARHGRRTPQAFRAIGAPGVLAAGCLAATFIAFLSSMLMTTVAAAVFVFSASPFFAALLGWLLLRERVARRTWVAIAAVVPGIGLMVADGVTAGTLAGNLVALAAAVGYGASIVALRRGRDVDMLPAVFLAGLFAAAASWGMAPDLAVGGRDLALALALGVTALGLQYVFITLGARRVPAAEVTLLTLVEAVLSPIWVWLAVGEVPTPLSVLGGLVLLGAVAAHAATALRARSG